VLWQKSPLRRIVARAPQVELDEERDTAKISSFLHTLECGHQVWATPFQQYDENWKYITVLPANKRHRCAECKGLLDAKKKPQSAKSKKRGVA
jgi:hypothetical protein